MAYINKMIFALKLFFDKTSDVLTSLEKWLFSTNHKYIASFNSFGVLYAGLPLGIILGALISVLLRNYIWLYSPLVSRLSLILWTCVFVITLLVLCAFILMLILDNIYRPNVPQYPWNFWIDRVVPTMFLVTPSIGILFLSPFETWFSRFTLLLCIHIFVLVPILKKWSSLRLWSSDFSTIPESSWRHPRLFLHIALAMIYPLLWGIFFSLSRYISLGQTFDLTNHFLYNRDFFIVSLFLAPYLFFWFLPLLNFLRGLRQYLWEECYSLIFSIHRSLLSNNIYFQIMKKVHRFAFITDSFLHPFSSLFHNPWPPLAKVTSFFFYNPWVIPILIFVFVGLELVYTTGHLYYSLYLFFLYPLYRGIYFCLHGYTYCHFTYDVCFADFIAANWQNPKYPALFWFYTLDSEFYFGYKIKVSEEVLASIQKLAEPYVKRFHNGAHYDRYDALYMRVRGKRAVSISTQGITIYGPCRIQPLFVRLAAEYKYYQHARWMHTSATTNRAIHSAVVYLVKDPIDFLVLINKRWAFFSLVEQQTSNKIISWPVPNQLYVDPLPIEIPAKPQSFAQVLETNLAVTLQPCGVRVGITSLMRGSYPNLATEFNQVSPDITLISFFNTQVLIGVDQKSTRTPGIGRNQALSDISEARYKSTLDFFKQEYRRISPNDISESLKHLKETSNNFNLHRECWANSLSKFEPHWRPPLRLSQNFYTGGLQAGVVASLAHAEEKILKLSERLYDLGVPQTSSGKLQSYDFLKDAIINDILSSFDTA